MAKWWTCFLKYVCYWYWWLEFVSVFFYYQFLTCLVWGGGLVKWSCPWLFTNVVREKRGAVYCFNHFHENCVVLVLRVDLTPLYTKPFSFFFSFDDSLQLWTSCHEVWFPISSHRPLYFVFMNHWRITFPETWEKTNNIKHSSFL